jgi:hypothetical protein
MFCGMVDILRLIWGIRNTGVGTILDLTERQAGHDLRLGTLVQPPLLPRFPRR